MGRLFCEHKIREIQSLDGAWNFRTDPQNIGEANRFFDSFGECRTAIVPSVWNTTEGLLTYEGVAWYSRSFYTRGGTLRFCFDAVMTEARVWLDGEYIGSHYGGFCAFDILVRNVSEGDHTLTVRVDNGFNAQSIPQAKVDWYHYGGITRSVRVERLCGISILSERLEYGLSADLKVADCRIVAELYNADDEARCACIEAYLDYAAVSSLDVSLKGGETRSIELPAFSLESPRIWNEGAPELYRLCLKCDGDDLYDRVGFRRVEARDNKIFLNGKEIEIRGVNRHEEHPEFGFAFPPSLMGRDIDLALEMGCNALRGSHYPNAREFLDMLDERGILFWSEIPIWGCGFSTEALADPVVVARGLDMHREMVKNYYNHPAIVIWGMHNEINTDTEAALAMTKLYYSFLKENGGNRIVTYASHMPLKDICLEYCDMISLNMYFGWYYGYEEDAWEKFLETFTRLADEKGVGDKPIAMSEFGCAAVYGCHDDENILWSEENQAKQIGHCLEVFHAHERVVGSFIWQFCDIRTCLQAGLNRARGFNNKGLLNEHRKPKLAYREAKRLYNGFKEEQ